MNDALEALGQLMLSLPMNHDREEAFSMLEQLARTIAASQDRPLPLPVP